MRTGTKVCSREVPPVKEDLITVGSLGAGLNVMMNAISQVSKRCEQKFVCEQNAEMRDILLHNGASQNVFAQNEHCTFKEAGYVDVLTGVLPYDSDDAADLADSKWATINSVVDYLSLIHI